MIFLQTLIHQNQNMKCKYSFVKNTNAISIFFLYDVTSGNQSSTNTLVVFTPTWTKYMEYIMQVDKWWSAKTASVGNRTDPKFK